MKPRDPFLLVEEQCPLTDERLETLLRRKPGLSSFEIAQITHKPLGDVWQRLDEWRKAGRAVLDGGWRLA